MAPAPSTSLTAFLHDFISPEALVAQARALGVVQRQRKAHVLSLVSAILFTLPVRGRVSRAAMWRAYLRRTGKTLSRSAFFKRFNKALAELMRWLLDTIIQRARDRPPTYTGLLEGFRDVIAADSSTIALPPALRDIWPGTTDDTAAIKLHTQIRATTGELLKDKITAGTAADSKHFGVTWADAGSLFLLDRGYSGASLWFRIARVGGFFVTRLPASYKPTILRSHRNHRGRARPVAGRKLREVLDEVERRVLIHH
jgi:hypothetical protein